MLHRIFIAQQYKYINFVKFALFIFIVTASAMCVNTVLSRRPLPIPVGWIQSAVRSSSETRLLRPVRRIHQYIVKRQAN
jgi:hypothetical protein